MKSGFIRVAMSDPEPPLPGPIVVTTPAQLGAKDVTQQPEPSRGKRSDSFYDAWDKFLALEPKRAKSISTAARKVAEEKEAVAQTPGECLQVEESAATSWEQAAAECKAKVAIIVEECGRLNQKYCDEFNLEADPFCLQSLTGQYPKAVDQVDPPPWIKRVEDIFDNAQFFVDGATATDVLQGNAGDCWFLASLMAVSAKTELVENICVARNEKAGVYGFVFYRDGEWIYEIIDDKLFLRVGDDDDLQVVRDWDKEDMQGLPIKHDKEKLKAALQRGSEALYFSRCKSDETWLPLIEKAYAKAHGDYFAIEGGFASEGIEDLTGGVSSVLNPEDIMDKERFWREQLRQVNQKYLFGGGSKPKDTKGFIGGHAYAVLEAWEGDGLKLLKLRNPWGQGEWDGDWSDGSKLWTADMMNKLNHKFGDDGVFWISYKDFLQHFQSINRVRLFTKDWQVAQQWTCVNVPWTVDFLDTNFTFSIEKRGPVVLVLQQPDDRYFHGLSGRFLYSLHFRVYKQGEPDRWIVRSVHNSGADTVVTRSVSAEIEDCEPGTYEVLIKVTATRSVIQPTAEEVIFMYAATRKEKLLHVGRRLDYAQTKGNLRAMEETIQRQRRKYYRDKEKSALKSERKENQKLREKARMRKKRIDEAMREKRRAFDEQRRAKARQRQRSAVDGRENESTDVQVGGGVEDKGESKSNDITPPSDESIAHSQDTGATASLTKSETPTQTGEKGSDVVEELSKLQLRSTHDSREDHRRRRDVSPYEEDEYELPLERPDELDDDDFDWDSEMDGPLDSDSEDEDASRIRRKSSSSRRNEIFADDPWNASCVLGLRVYSLASAATVKVVKGEHNS